MTVFPSVGLSGFTWQFNILLNQQVEYVKF